MFPFTADEFDRITILPEFGDPDAGDEAEFDDVVGLASETLGLPLAMISLVGVDNMTVMAAVGMPLDPIPRGIAFCAHTILSDDLLIVTDLREDDRFRTNPWVAGGPGICFYAGAPIVSSEGVRLGALSVMGTEPRRLDDADRLLLRGLARIVSGRLETRRKRLRAQAEVEQRLSESEELCRTALRLAKLVPLKCDARGRILSVGDEWIELTGFADTSLLALSWINFIHHDDVEAFCEQWRDAISRGVSFEAEMRLQTASGVPIWCRTRSTPAFDAAGRINGWYGLFENIEEERRVQGRLAVLQAQIGHFSRLSAMETMASTLAHELNQPLVAITQYVRASQRLLARLDDERTAPIVGALEEAAVGALRAGGIVRSVRALVSRGDVQRCRESIDTIIGDAVRIAFIDAEELGIDYRIGVDSALPRVLVDAIQIQQVLINLIRNAVQALRDVSDRLIVITARAMSADECSVTVSDTGPGLPTEIAARLFTPFNTSKSDGMGIGLSISRTIIEAHGGQIHALPVMGSGTAFRFTLPFA